MCLVLLGVDPIAGESASNSEEGTATGAFKGEFTLRVEASHPATIAKRFDERLDDSQVSLYNIADETFDVYVPPGYDGKTRYGILVWMSGGEPPEAWRNTLDQQKLIWVAPNGVRPGRNDYECYGLAIDALANIAKDYKKIDKKRLIIGGSDYGGRMAMRMGIAYSDTFAGATTIGDVDFFRRVDLPSNALMRYSAAYNKPAGNAVGVARQMRRYVFFVPEGESQDGQLMATIINGFGEMKFRYTQTVTIQGYEPSEEQFAGAVQFMAP